MCKLQSNISTVIPRRGINDEGKGKKYALHRLISAASTEYIWMLDDDVIPPPAQQIGESVCCSMDLIILPLRMKAEGNSLLERLQIAEYAALQQLTMVMAQRGHAVMCSGANMIVRRDRWLESYEDLHPQIVSGDDMFLLESFKRRGLQVGTLDRPEFTATVMAERSWRRFFLQRMRWAGKAPHYTDRDIRAFGALVVMANVLQVLCPLLLLIKFPLEYRLIKERDASVSFFTALLLELVYPFYMFICLVGGLFRRQW